MTAAPSNRARLRGAGLLARRGIARTAGAVRAGGRGAVPAVRRPPAARGRRSGRGGGGAPVSRAVTIGPRDLEVQRASFRAAWKREPATSELADLMEAFISEEMLFREGAALGLDRDDAVVRRRLIEKATALARPSAPVSEPEAAELRRWYQMYPHRFQQPAAFSLEQLYFDARKHADARAAASAALAALASQPAATPAPAGRGRRVRAADQPDRSVAGAAVAPVRIGVHRRRGGGAGGTLARAGTIQLWPAPGAGDGEAGVRGCPRSRRRRNTCAPTG